MRKDLKDIEHIEYYLQGKLSTEEKEQFEYRLSVDAELAIDVSFQKILLERVRVLYLKEKISKAHSRNVTGFHKGWLGKIFLLGTIIIILSVVMFFLLKTGNNPKQALVTYATIQIDTLAIDQPVQLKIDSTIQDKSEKIPSSTPKAIESHLIKHFFNLTKFHITEAVCNTTGKFIECKKGTIIYIPDSCFNTEKEVQLTITEYKGAYDIFMSKLSTTSKGQLLETHGMVNIEATANGKPISLRKDKRIMIMFAKRKEDKREFDLYQGEKNKNGDINWNLQTASMSDFTLSSSAIHAGYNKWPKNINYEIYDDFPINENFKKLQLDSTDYTLIDNHLIFGVQRFGIDFDINEKGIITNLKTKESTINSMTKAKMFNHFKSFADTFKLKNIEKNKEILGSYQYFIFFNSNFDYSDFSQKFSERYNTLNRKYLNYYVFGAQRTGWLNCDRLININTPKVNVVIKEKNVFDSYYMLLLCSYNTYVTPQLSSGHYVLKQIPSNSQAILVGVKYINNQPLLSITKVLTGAKEIKPDKFEPINFEELEEKLNSLGLAK